MRRPIVSAVTVTLLALALLVPPIISAQEASPAASPGAMAGVTIEPLGALEVLPGLAVPVVRVELAPGAIAAPHRSPGPAVAQVESGEVSFAIVTGVANRATLTVVVPAGTPMAGTPMTGSAMDDTMQTDAMGTPMAAGTPVAEAVSPFAVVEEELSVVGEETSLSAGEGVAFGPDVIHTFRNTGTEPAVLILVGDLPPDQPVFRIVEGEPGVTPAGTPTP